MPVTVCAIAREQEGQPPTHINGIYFLKHIVIKLDKKMYTNVYVYMYANNILSRTLQGILK